MADDTEELSFHVGDSNLRFLGLAAGLAARYQWRRKGGSVPHEDYPQSDAHALALFMEGVEAAKAWPPDDVPELRVTVHGRKETVVRLVRLMQSDGGGDDPEGWKG